MALTNGYRVLRALLLPFWNLPNALQGNSHENFPGLALEGPQPGARFCSHLPNSSETLEQPSSGDKVLLWSSTQLLSPGIRWDFLLLEDT